MMLPSRFALVTTFSFGAKKFSKLLTRLLKFGTSVFIIFISKNKVFTENKQIKSHVIIFIKMKSLKQKPKTIFLLQIVDKMSIVTLLSPLRSCFHPS